MSVLSDGSQARKTKNEKELVLVRIERSGIPIYFVVSLLDMASFGGSDADSLKLALDSVFCIGNEDGMAAGNVPLIDYTTKLVSATADGANVNMGIYTGALTQLAEIRPWLIKIHCVSHRLELAIKDAVSDISKFQECDSFYISLYYLFKNSGKLKTEVRQACDALNITYYPLPKIQGTRFVNHRRGGFTKLMHCWPAIVTSFENVLASNKGCKAETRAKVSGLLRKLKSYRFLSQVAVYLDVLESIGPLSLVFEQCVLMVYDVQPAVEKCLMILDDLKEESLDEAINSFLKQFSVKDENGVTTVVASYAKQGHERRKPANREYIEIEMADMTFTEIVSMEKALQLRAEAIEILVPLIKDRFKSFESEIFQSMMWMDPQYWVADRDNEKEAIKKLSNVFAEPLEVTGFDLKKALTEWRSLQITAKAYYRNLPLKEMWEKFFTYRKTEFPNILILAELVMCMSSSNSSVERSFSVLTTILTDRRLSMNHDTMEECILIAGNDSIWSNQEREEILLSAVRKYRVLRRNTRFEEKSKEDGAVIDIGEPHIVESEDSSISGDSDENSNSEVVMSSGVDSDDEEN